jgi:sterol desaturase/sphingolipid hydroxylase (fatty acid hydroxylase superfamily)
VNPLVVVSVSAVCLVVFVALDARDAGFRSSWTSDRARLRRNAAFLVSNLVTIVVLNAVTRALAPVLPRAFTWQSTGAVDVVVEVAACILVAELVNWLSHWAKHKQAWLWRFHLQHHVETRYSVNLTLHTHGVEVVVTGALMSSLLVVLGFSRFAVDAFTVVYFCANLYKHCSARMSLGPLDALLVGPAYHRLHHARAADMGGWHGNYGSVLTVFDVLFGTARFPERHELDDVYARTPGVDGDEPFGFVDEMLAPFVPASRAAATRPSAAE